MSFVAELDCQEEASNDLKSIPESYPSSLGLSSMMIEKSSPETPRLRTKTKRWHYGGKRSTSGRKYNIVEGSPESPEQPTAAPVPSTSPSFSPSSRPPRLVPHFNPRIPPPQPSTQFYAPKPLAPVPPPMVTEIEQLEKELAELDRQYARNLSIVHKASKLLYDLERELQFELKKK